MRIYQNDIIKLLKQEREKYPPLNNQNKKPSKCLRPSFKRHKRLISSGDDFAT